ncbi:uncharacterized protein LOC122509089 [Leptopilina heterotoma]|uniref:uncharacterized protein LOC122509089 n=1 Tax=Leptopilina heterotoma TaxID=63436 RepID=UPI001CA89773|nr:uncharacterized protein LOC122509089 [Leptopilina heterotoma]
MKIIIFSIFILCALNIKFGDSQYNINLNNGYNVTDLNSDIQLIKKSLIKYKEKTHSQLKMFHRMKENEIETYFTHRIESYLENSKNNSTRTMCLSKFVTKWKDEVQRHLQELEICVESVMTSSYIIPLEDTDFLLSVLGGNFSSNIEAIVKDCQHWSSQSSNKVSVEDCYTLKSPLFQMLSTSFLKVTIQFKKLVLNCTVRAISDIKNCDALTKELLETHWSFIYEGVEKCLF